MSYAFALPVSSRNTPYRIVLNVVRRWHVARERNIPALPFLCESLAAERCEILAPVFDSLFRLYELALGKPLAAGQGPSLSDDEILLMELLSGTKNCRQSIAGCADGKAACLECALSSTRVMMTKTIKTRLGSRY